MANERLGMSFLDKHRTFFYLLTNGHSSWSKYMVEIGETISSIISLKYNILKFSMLIQERTVRATSSENFIKIE